MDDPWTMNAKLYEFVCLYFNWDTNNHVIVRILILCVSQGYGYVVRSTPDTYAAPNYRLMHHKSHVPLAVKI